MKQPQHHRESRDRARLTRVPREDSSITMASSFKWDHPNGRGVLLPGQTHCHTGKLVPFDDYDLDATCELVCSPCGRFPDPDAPVRVKGTAHLAGAMVGKSADKENRDARTNVPPMETAGWALMGCKPCGSTKRWSCCGTCAGGCRMWSEEGYVMTGGPKPTGADDDDDAPDDDGAPKLGGPLEGTPDAAEFASWDGCVAIPTPAVVPLPEPRLEGAHGERIARLTVGRGAVTCIAVSGCGTRMACGGSDGSCVVYAIDPAADDLAPELLCAAYPGRPLTKPPTRRQKNAAAVVCLDSDSDAEDPEAGLDADELAEKRERDAMEDARVASETTEGGHEGAVSCVAFHPDAASFYTGSADGTCKRWKIPPVADSGAKPPALMSTYAHKTTEERGAVRCLRVSDDGARLYVGGEEACLAVYDAGSGDVIARTYSPRWPEKDKDGLGVPPVDDEDEDPESAEKAAKAAAAKAEREAAMTPEELAAVRDAEADAAEAKAKYLEEKRYRNKPKGFGGVNTVLCIAGGAGESGDLVFTGSRDCNVRRWAVSGDAPVVERVIPGHKAPVTAIAVSRDGSELVTGGARGDGELRHYRWQPVRGVDAEYIDGKLKSNDGSYVRVRTIRRGPEGFKETAHPEGVLAALISPDERYLYTVGDEGGVEVAISRWSVETGAEDKDFRIETNHQGGVTSLCLFPDVAPPGSDAAVGVAAVTRATAARAGGRILTGGADGCVDLWTAERHDDGAGQQLAAEIAQQEAAMAATEYQRAQVKLTALSPELSRPAMAARGRKELPALEAAKFPIDEETGMKKDLEDFTVEDFEPFTANELISMCCAHGLLFIDPKKPPESKRAIAERMVAFFREEKEKARIAAREERMGLAQPAKSRARPRIPGIEPPEEKKQPASGDEESEASETELSETELSETEVDDKKDEE